MSVLRNKLELLLLVVCLGLLVPAAAAWADCTATPGTVITKQNWMQYKDCFPEGIQGLWQGTLGFWKMPDDVEIHVGQPHQYTLPRPYQDATEKYGGQTRLERQPDGQFRLVNYVAGLPFPNPTEPDKGTKIAANITYRFQPAYVGVFVDLGNNGFLYSKDRFGNTSAQYADALYRQLAYGWEPEYPRTEPRAAGMWYSQWIMSEWPEQSKYTTALTVLWQDNLKDDDYYAFVPALRRALRLSSSARCSPVLGTDIVRDDQRVGWNGGVGKFMGKWLRDQKILTLQAAKNTIAGDFPAQFDGILGWPKPSWGDWEVRDSYVIDVRRVPAYAPGYCYGSRVMYVDKQYYQTLHEDIFDANLKLWKVYFAVFAPAPFRSYSMQMGLGGVMIEVFDVQNDHASYLTSFNKTGKVPLYDDQLPNRYDDVPKYCTASGLQQVLR
jgi:hypothetical protein